MNIDDVITLDDNKEYVILTKAEYENNNYFLASQLENAKLTENYKIFKEVSEDGELFVDEITNPKIKDVLIDTFEKNFDELETDN